VIDVLGDAAQWARRQGDAAGDPEIEASARRWARLHLALSQFDDARPQLEKALRSSGRHIAATTERSGPPRSGSSMHAPATWPKHCRSRVSFTPNALRPSNRPPGRGRRARGLPRDSTEIPRLLPRVTHRRRFVTSASTATRRLSGTKTSRLCGRETHGGAHAARRCAYAGRSAAPGLTHIPLIANNTRPCRGRNLDNPARAENCGSPRRASRSAGDEKHGGEQHAD
jgi:hypothetical protein